MCRRVGAALAALLLLVNLALPLAGASANSSNLPSVGWAETVSSFLMSCGIYPFETDENGNYTEWSASSLVPLWNQFKEDVTGVSNDITDLIGYLVNGVLAIASGRWSVLREFASWIVNKFNVTDNQTGVELGSSLGSGVSVPVFGSLVNQVFWSSLDKFLLAGTFNYRGNSQNLYCILNGTTAGAVLYGYVPAYSSGVYYRQYYILSRSSWDGTFTILYPISNSSNTPSSSPILHSYNGVSVYYTKLDYTYYPQTLDDWSFSAVPEFSSFDDMIASFLGFATSSFSGVTADTTTVSIPAELPADTQYGGLTIAGAGAAVTVEALTEIVQEAVIEGLKPIVGVVGVNLSPDIEINPDTGEITQGEITITPADIDLVASDYQIRQLHTVFPFSIPWDVYNVFSALNAEPVRPYWEVSLTLPGILGQPDTQVPFTIGISDESSLAGPVDDFAALIRNFLLVLMCVATLFGVWRMIR